MQKIPTMYPRDEAKRGHPVTPGVKPECAWVEAGEGIATRKIEGGKLFKRQKPKDGREYDEAAYVEARRDDPSDRYIFEAFDNFMAILREPVDAIYEALGPKIQGNVEKQESHRLIRVVPPLDELVIPADHLVRTFDGIRAFLTDREFEGIVFHHQDGRMAKIKRRDFGLPWPVVRVTGER